MALFDAYLVVDWSANSTPKRGADSIWYALADAADEGAPVRRLANPATRAQAVAELRTLLLRLAGEGKRVLVGFDFPNAYPQGFAQAAGFRGAPWRAVWDGLAGLVHDGADNANNRFEVAAELNRRVSGADAPFWGCPEGRVNGHLSTRKPARGTALAERRLCEEWLRGTQPCWKLYTTGSVGGQALLGIPALRALREDAALAPSSRVWPFETGLRAPQEGAVIFAEIFPSLAGARRQPGLVRDALQVSAMAALLAARDAGGALAEDFAGPAALTAAQRRLVEREEGWILGAGTLAPPPPPPCWEPPERLPEAIYRRSFAMIGEAAELAHLPPALAPVAARLIHACGMPDLVDDLSYSPDLVRAARRALRGGAPLLCDSRMVASGIMRERLPARNEVLCLLGDRRVPALARRLGATRSAAAVELWRERLSGALVVIGNAPTALFHLLRRIGEGAPRPAAILGFPVGFVGAAESKLALAACEPQVPYLTLFGRRGGSALAAAAVNALAEMG